MEYDDEAAEGLGRYVRALELAGAEVLEAKRFGSYSGVGAYVVRLGGEVSVILEFFGSCSGCDPLYHIEASEDDDQHERLFREEGERMLPGVGWDVAIASADDFSEDGVREWLIDARGRL